MGFSRRVDATRLTFGLPLDRLFSMRSLCSGHSRENISSYSDNPVQVKTFIDYMIAFGQHFIALCKSGLRLKPENCTFLVDEAKFIAYITTSDSTLTPDRKKNSNVSSDVFVWIRQFLKITSTRTNPIRHVLHPDDTNSIGSLNHLSGLKEPIKSAKKSRRDSFQQQ